MTPNTPPGCVRTINDPKLTSRLCEDHLTKKESDGELQQMTWPPQLPDLNPGDSGDDLLKLIERMPRVCKRPERPDHDVMALEAFDRLTDNI